MQSSLEILTEALPCHIGIYPWENPTLSTWVSRGCTPCYRHRIPVGFGISCTSKHVKRMKCRVPRLHYCHSPHIPLLSCTWLCASSEGLERNLGTPPQLLRFSAFSLRQPKRQTGKKNPQKCTKSQPLPRCSSSHQTLGESLVLPTPLQSHLELSLQGALPNPHASLDSPKPARKEEAK